MAYLKFAIFALGSGSIGYILLNSFTAKEEEPATDEDLFLVRSTNTTKYEEKLLRVLHLSTKVDPMLINKKPPVGQDKETKSNTGSK